MWVRKGDIEDELNIKCKKYIKLGMKNILMREAFKLLENVVFYGNCYHTALGFSNPIFLASPDAQEVM